MLLITSYNLQPVTYDSHHKFNYKQILIWTNQNHFLRFSM